MQHSTGPFKAPDVQDHVLTIVENDIANTIIIERPTPVGSQQRLGLFKSMNDGNLASNLHKDQPDELFVHNIVGHRQTTNGLQYQVEWYSNEGKDDTFEPSSNIPYHFLSWY